MMIRQLIRSIIKQFNKDIPSIVHGLLKDKEYNKAKQLLLKYDYTKSHKQLCLMAEVEYYLGNFDSARSMFVCALEIKPGYVEAHYGLSLVYYEIGYYEEALLQALYARNSSKNNARFLAQLGLCYIGLNQLFHAGDVLHKAVLIDPENISALNNMSIVMHAQNDLIAANRYLRRCLDIAPNYQPALDNYRLFNGVEYAGQDNPASDPRLEQYPILNDPKKILKDDEITELEKQLKDQPESSEIALILVNHYLENLELDEAILILQFAIQHNSKNIQLHLQAAILAKKIGKAQRAKAIYEMILSWEPKNTDALIGLAKVEEELGEFEEANNHMAQAVAIKATPTMVMELAFTQNKACYYEECLLSCERAEAMDSALGQYLLSTRAIAYTYLGDFNKASQYIDAMSKYPNIGLDFQVFTGMVNLLKGNYREGWKGYGYRFFESRSMPRLLPYPLWRGESLENKTILLLAEQGLGDQVMFASCLNDLLDLSPAKIYLEVNKRVAKTFMRSFPGVSVIPSIQQYRYEWISGFKRPDYYLPLASLAASFRNSLEEFPRHFGYLVADPVRANHWRERLMAIDQRPWIGISWRGGLQITRRRIRSLTLEQILPIVSDRRFSFVSLQYGEVQEEIEQFCSDHGRLLHSFPEAVDDLDEFAALITALHGVITVCNTTVHYSGALNKPCWVLVPYVPEWRYGLSYDTMPWYPSVRLFRQQQANHWDAVISSIRSNLMLWI